MKNKSDASHCARKKVEKMKCNEDRKKNYIGSQW